MNRLRSLELERSGETSSAGALMTTDSVSECASSGADSATFLDLFGWRPMGALSAASGSMYQFKVTPRLSSWRRRGRKIFQSSKGGGRNTPLGDNGIRPLVASEMALENLTHALMRML